MKNNYLLTILSLSLFLVSCSTDDSIKQNLDNTENSILITGINESISYTFTSNNGRKESSIPEDINMIQILILGENDELVYEQYHYNQNAYNEYYYDSADHQGDDYLFENTLPDTLYIPPLPDGNYTILASTTYTSYYDYNYTDDSLSHNYPFIESYQVSDAPIFVGKASTEVSQDTDALVVLDMQNISARIDLNITASTEEWNLELNIETLNNQRYSFQSESLESTGYDYDNLYIWRDGYWNQGSYYFLPRDLKKIHFYFYEYSTNFNVNYEFDIDPDLKMESGDVFSLNIDLDALIEGGGSAGLSWESVDWNDVGEVTIP